MTSPEVEDKPKPEHVCMNENRCIDKVDGHARETARADTFCEACFSRASERVAQLPEQYVGLHNTIGDRHAGVDVNIKHAKPSSSVLLNLHIDTLLGSILDAVTSAAEVVAERMGMDDPTDPTPKDPAKQPKVPPWADSPKMEPEEQVKRCCRIIEPNLPLLAGITGVGGREPGDPAIDVGFWNHAGTLHGTRCTTGVLMVQRMDYLSSLAHFTLGQTRARSERDVPCTRCRAKKVGRWAGSDYFDCASCGGRFEEDDVRRQDKILLELHRRGLITLGKEAS
jgi:hypothetical protein